MGDRRFVAVGNKLLQSPKWKTFLDFLFDYMRIKLGTDWANEELKRELSQRHPIMQWYDAVAKTQSLERKGCQAGVVKSYLMNGAIICFMGTAYNLYLLEHNAELQERYIKRLLDKKNFQGTYYELIVAGILLRAGFRLELEDEANNATKHCEFSAVSQTTGQKYWVEAKMRSVEGILGKSKNDGVKATDRDATRNLTTHLNSALQKPAYDQRLIFIDLNAEIVNPDSLPDWFNKAVKRLDAKERDLKEGHDAYVFVTNLPFHRYLGATSIARQALAYGLGISDFSKPATRSLRETYHLKQKHIDGHEIMGAIRDYPVFPDTFDGSLRSDESGLNIKIGESYLFSDLGEPPGTIGTVTAAAVNEDKSEAMVAVTTLDGKNMILSQKLTGEQLDDYRKFPDLFFGEQSSNGGNIEDPLQLFEFLLKTYSKSTREKLLEFMSVGSYAVDLKALSQPELAELYCERLALNFFVQHAPEVLNRHPR
ncbi:hypothetical protein N183_32250 [Sinorhizobium sp. Sb3]|nr:hypothetical protein N183_32250 [Sinorhizobium sp. Sb3]